MSKDLLLMEHITKIYGNGIVANKDVSFRLKEGEIHALIGENGAGKSTLMKILFGMEKPTSGKILLNGESLSFNSSKDAIASGIGMVHQHFMLVESFTVAQNIVLGMEPRKNIFVDKEKSIAFTKELSEKYNLHVDPNAIVSDISVGMKQKIEILKALARGAKILILDEPTAVLTPQETELFFEELKHLKNQGHTLVFISHKIREIKEISDRITIMRGGRLVGEFNTNELNESEISNKIVGRDMFITYDKPPIPKQSSKLKVRNLTYYSDDKVALVNNLSFDVQGGRIIGIAGVEGNGQSQLAQLLTKGLQPASGNIEVNESKIEKLSMYELRRKGLGYIPEDRMERGIAKDGTIQDNFISNKYTDIDFCKNGFMNYSKIEKSTKEAIDKYEVLCYGPQQKISMLSGGNMQKVIVARECFNDPDVLIAEQPTRGVDIGAVLVIHNELLKMRKSGCAILLISADLNEVMELSDSIMVMYQGEIVAYFEDASKVDENELGLYMLGIKKQDQSIIKEVVSHE